MIEILALALFTAVFGFYLESAGPSREILQIVFSILGGAVVLFVARDGRKLASALVPMPASTPPQPRTLLPLFWCAGFACLAVSYYFFGKGETYPNTAWALYAGALFLLMLPLALSDLRACDIKRPSKATLLVALSILAVASAFRFYLLDSYPYGIWYDEAQNGIVARQILANPAYRPAFIPDLSQLPALPFYYYAAMLSIFGDSIQSLRLATTLIGIASVFATWFCARAFFGNLVGICAAFLIAVSHWHVDFSRFAMAQIFCTLFVPLSVGLYLYTMRSRRLSLAALTGISLGLGVQTYYSMLVVPLILVASFALTFLAGGTRSRRHCGLLALMLLFFVATYMPVIEYAQRDWGAYSQRISNVSWTKPYFAQGIVHLFSAPDQRSEFLWALYDTTRQHLGMLHIEGDHNGRHNLPGEPLLDPVSGFFFGIGFIWLFARWREESFALLFLWGGAFLSAGIFSLTFEAPQGGRTLGVITAVAAIAALPMAALLDEMIRGRMFSKILSAGVLLTSVVFAVRYNWNVFFQKQRFDFDSWTSFSTSETFIGKMAQEVGGAADIYLPAELNNTPTQKFILGKSLEAQDFNPAQQLPLPNTGRDALIIIQAGEFRSPDLIKEFYPHAEVEVFRHTLADGRAGQELLSKVRITREDIDALQKIERTLVRRDGSTETTSMQGISFSEIEEGSAATFRGVLRIDKSGAHRLVVNNSSECSIKFGEGNFKDCTSLRSTPIELPQGLSPFELRVRAPSTDTARMKALWFEPESEQPTNLPRARLFAPSAGAGGLLGAYRAGEDCAGPVSFTQIDPQLGTYFHLTPLPYPFSITWNGYMTIPAESPQRLILKVNAETTVSIDGVAELSTSTGSTYLTSEKFFAPGTHKVDICFHSGTGYAQIYLGWKSEAEQIKLVPRSALSPYPPVQPTR